jgi:hypothetical protein
LKLKIIGLNKLKCLFITLLFISIGEVSIAQKRDLDPVSIDSAFWTIQKNTFRINLTLPVLSLGDIPEGTGILTGIYEWSQKRKFSLVTKLGINSYDDYQKSFLSNNFYVKNFLIKFSYQAYASVEQRYYFNFNRRIRKAKPILNNSGTYLGLEARYLSNAYMSPNDNSFKTPSPGLKIYYNIGQQVQKNKYFANFHFGIQSNLESITSGIGIGYVF